MTDLNAAKAIVRDRRERAEKARETLMERLMADAVFEDAYRKKSWLDFEIARRSVYGLEAETLRKEREELSARLSSIAADKGIRGWDEPDYFCAKCSDTGYRKGGKCECLEEARIKVNLDRNPSLAAAPRALRDIDFSFYGDKSAEYTKYAIFLHNNFLRGALNLCTLIGAPGTGKTYIAEATLAEALYGGSSVSVINSVRLNRIFLEYHCAPLEKKAAVWSVLIEPDVLLADDLGVEAVLNNVTLQYLYELLTERAEKKTILTGNLSLRGLEEKYGQRIMSRLADKRRAAVLKFGGADYRLN